jgi:hypothetical protein
MRLGMYLWEYVWVQMVEDEPRCILDRNPLLVAQFHLRRQKVPIPSQYPLALYSVSLCEFVSSAIRFSGGLTIATLHRITDIEFNFRFMIG